MIWPVMLLIIISCLHVSSDCMLESINLLNETSKSVSTAAEEAISDLNSFKRLYRSLKEYYENELNKLNSKYDLLEEQLIASEKNIRLSTLTCICNVTDNSNNSRTKDIQLKVDQIYEKLSTITDTNPSVPSQTNELQQKIDQMYEKLSNITNSKPSAPINCPTNQFDQIKRNKRTRGKYVGCFLDAAHHRGLKGFIRKSKSNTIESCIEICRNGHYVYAGLQWSKVCLCDNTIQTEPNVQLAEGRCNSPCSGNSSQKCGAEYVNSIYETGVEQYLIHEDGHQLTDSYIKPSAYIYFKSHDENTQLSVE